MAARMVNLGEAQRIAEKSNGEKALPKETQEQLDVVLGGMEDYMKSQGFVIPDRERGLENAKNHQSQNAMAGVPM